MFTQWLSASKSYQDFWSVLRAQVLSIKKLICQQTFKYIYNLTYFYSSISKAHVVKIVFSLALLLIFC